MLNRFGLVCAWDVKTANVYDADYDADFAPLIEQFDEQTLVLADSNFHAKAGDPQNLKICPRAQWNDRMLIETVLSMLTRVCQINKVGHRVWSALKRGWRFAWQPSICVRSGTGCRRTKRALFTSVWHSSLSKTSTNGYIARDYVVRDYVANGRQSGWTEAILSCKNSGFLTNTLLTFRV